MTIVLIFIGSLSLFSSMHLPSLHNVSFGLQLQIISSSHAEDQHAMRYNVSVTILVSQKLILRTFWADLMHWQNLEEIVTRKLHKISRRSCEFYKRFSPLKRNISLWIYFWALNYTICSISRR